jgi:curved DNA-binding protein CbpA
MATHYEVLGITTTATAAEVKTAYRKLARAFHPDRHGGNPQAGAKFTAINDAYVVLSDPAQRAAYDLSLRPTAPPPAAPHIGVSPEDAQSIAPLDESDVETAAKLGAAGGALLTGLALKTRGGQKLATLASKIGVEDLKGTVSKGLGGFLRRGMKELMEREKGGGS